MKETIEIVRFDRESGAALTIIGEKPVESLGADPNFPQDVILRLGIISEVKVETEKGLNLEKNALWNNF